MIVSYLIFLFKRGFACSYLNAARSSFSFFSLDKLSLGQNVIICRLFRYFYLQRPLRQRYVTFWPVYSLLNHLKEWYPIENLSMKQLTLKCVSLLALTSSDRGQSIHLTNINQMHVSDGHIKFVINKRIKTTRRVLKPTIVNCVSEGIPELNVAMHIQEYINKTMQYRDPNDESSMQLFISWKTFKPVTKQTIARWLTHSLRSAGIDTNRFKSHSYRGAGLSAAFAKGVSIDKIVSSGNWTNNQTFHSYYNAPADDSEVGRIILSMHGEWS